MEAPPSEAASSTSARSRRRATEPPGLRLPHGRPRSRGDPTAWRFGAHGGETRVRRRPFYEPSVGSPGAIPCLWRSA